MFSVLSKIVPLKNKFASFSKPYNEMVYLLKWIQQIAIFRSYQIIMIANVLCAISEITLCTNSTAEMCTTIDVRIC